MYFYVTSFGNVSMQTFG